MPSGILTNIVRGNVPLPLNPNQIELNQTLIIGSIPIGQGLSGSGYLRKLTIHYINLENFTDFNGKEAYFWLSFNTSPNLNVLPSASGIAFGALNISNFITFTIPPFAAPAEYSNIEYIGDNTIIDANTVINYTVNHRSLVPVVFGGLAIFYSYTLTYIAI